MTPQAAGQIIRVADAAPTAREETPARTDPAPQAPALSAPQAPAPTAGVDRLPDGPPVQEAASVSPQVAQPVAAPPLAVVPASLPQEATPAAASPVPEMLAQTAPAAGPETAQQAAPDPARAPDDELAAVTQDAPARQRVQKVAVAAGPPRVEARQRILRRLASARVEPPRWRAQPHVNRGAALVMSEPPHSLTLPFGVSNPAVQQPLGAAVMDAMAQPLPRHRPAQPHAYGMAYGYYGDPYGAYRGHSQPQAANSAD